MKFKKNLPKKKILFAVTPILILVFLFFVVVRIKNLVNQIKLLSVPMPTETPISSPTPTPTPRPLTFPEMNALYGPCVVLPTLMYHHVQTKEMAVSRGQTALTVETPVFKTQMEYLKGKGYVTVGMNDLVNFFDNGGAIPKKTVLITFDDGYEDFYTDAYPILRDLGFTATVFVPTGLMNNPGYLYWDQIASMNSIFFANHTWSHKNAMVAPDILQKEIATADTQLSERSLNSPKIFAYPYGLESVNAENLLSQFNYKLAFTTKNGNVLCKKQRLILPRIRIGNIPLSSYNF